MENTFQIDRVGKVSFLYFGDCYNLFRDYLHCTRPLDLRDIFFLKICTITFNEKSPRKDALENVLCSIRGSRSNLVYLIKGNKDCVSFYYGVVRDLIYVDDYTEKVELKIFSEGIKRTIEGNFRGSVVKSVADDETKSIMRFLANSKKVSVVEGVPSVLSDSDESSQFQRIDRLVDTMFGEEYAFVVTAKYMPDECVRIIEENLFELHRNLSFFSKYSQQSSESKSRSESSGTNSSKTKTEGTSDDGESESTAFCTGKNSGVSISEQTSQSETRERIDQRILGWAKYVEEVLLKRLDYGKGKGLFITSVSLFADSDYIIDRLGNVVVAMFSGDKDNKTPMVRCKLVNENDSRSQYLRVLQIPIGRFSELKDNTETLLRTAMSQFVTERQAFLGNWYSGKELSLVAGLPSREVPGIKLNEEVEFGLNPPKADDTDKLSLGKLVKSGNKTEIDVSISKKILNKHVFVCGVTGSGKTTTCMTLLDECKYPFLVIEPAKTEYRILAKDDSLDCLVFTLGDDDVAPFKLNPLQFLETETIPSHIDMVKACIEAAFHMEAAIPQIIEAALYKCYEEAGWDVAKSRYKNLSKKKYPKLEDLIRAVEKEVKEKKFGERLQGEYMGTINALLNGLVVGAKGSMLNTDQSIDFTKLIHRNVVIELEGIKSGKEKSLIMGFILMNLNEAIKAEFESNKNFRHITLVEEAHRLLSRYMPGDSDNKRNGVETFADMLAEVRKYGECLIIADQIPEKMTPEVLKNTNTKIVHKIFAQDDKDAMGNTMSLTREQKDYLSRLDVGYAVVFSQGWDKSVHIQVNKNKDTTNEEVDKDTLRKKAKEFYGKYYPSMKISIPFLVKKRFVKAFKNYLESLTNKSYLEELKKQIENLDSYSEEDIIKLLLDEVFHYEENEGEVKEKDKDFFIDFLGDVHSGKDIKDIFSKYNNVKKNRILK